MTDTEPGHRLQLLQQWECVVWSVSTQEFTAVLHDLTDRSKAEEEATFPLEEVPDSDRALVEPGAVFYWSIGYRTSSTGQRDRVSQIRFRRESPMNVEERIRTGALPAMLEGADWKRYRGTISHAPTWQGFAEAWWGIAWVRRQAFERDGEAEYWAEDYEEPSGRTGCGRCNGSGCSACCPDEGFPL